MPRVDQRYTARLPLPDLLVRGRDCVLECPVYRTGALVVPASATVSIYDATGTALISGANAPVTGSIPTYTLDGGDTTDAQLGEGWRVEWVVNLSDGTRIAPRNDAAMCRSGLWPVIADTDLIRRCPALDPRSASAVTSSESYQYAIDEAWTQIQLDLIAKGNRPNLIMEPSALRTVHLMLSLAIVYEGERDRLSTAWTDIATDYRNQYRTAWDALSFRYAVDDTETADLARRSARPTVWLTSRQ